MFPKIVKGGKLLLIALGFTIKWTFKTVKFILDKTIFKLLKKGIFLIMPKTPPCISYLINCCQMTYEFFTGDVKYIYRLSKKVKEKREKRLQNGKRVKFYHKTTTEAAGSIIKYNTFFRSEKGGHFGSGIYFCSNPNSTHNKANPDDKYQTILEVEILVGNITKTKVSKSYSFGDIISNNYDTVRGMSLKDDEYIIFCQDQICNIREYNNPNGYWGYDFGKHQSSVKGHRRSQAFLTNYHPNWFPFKAYGSRKYGNKKSLLVNFNGHNSRIVSYTPFFGSEYDLWIIYKNFIQGSYYFSKKKKKYIAKLENNLINEGKGNVAQPLDYSLFLKLIRKKYNPICSNNTKLPEYIKDSKW